MDPLSQLKDIHLPEPVGYWPLAWGWWVLLAIIVTLICVAIYCWRRHKSRNRYRTAALIELMFAKEAFDQHPDTARYLQNLSIILRRAALSGFPRTYSTNTTYHTNIKGEAWLQWLDDQCPGKQPVFTQGLGRILLTGPYEAKPETDVAALHQLAQHWLKQHRNQWQTNRTPKKKDPVSLVPTSAQQPEAATDA